MDNRAWLIATVVMQAMVTELARVARRSIHEARVRTIGKQEVTQKTQGVRQKKQEYAQ